MTIYLVSSHPASLPLVIQSKLHTWLLCRLKALFSTPSNYAKAIQLCKRSNWSSSAMCQALRGTCPLVSSHHCLSSRDGTWQPRQVHRNRGDSPTNAGASEELLGIEHLSVALRLTVAC